MKHKLSVLVLAMAVTACKAPVNGPTSVNFDDIDPSVTLGGDVVIGRSTNETDITSYRVRWGGAGECVAVSEQIAQVTKTGTSSALVYTLPAGTSLPSGADKILVFAKNLFGENPNCASVNIVNNQEVPNPPANPPVGVSFSDNDGTIAISGPITVTRAPDEFDITHYVLRYGNNGCNIAGNSLITEVAKTGSDVVYSLPPSAIPTGATQILAYSKNGWGEMANCTNAHVDIANYLTPTPPSETAQAVTFTDTDDSTTVGGNIAITKAFSEENILYYVLRWGNSAGCNVGDQIAQVTATGADTLSYTLPAGTTPPGGATKILAYTKNNVGEMSDCYNVSTPVTNTLGQWVTLTHASSGECMQAPSGNDQLWVDSCDPNNSYQRWTLSGSGGTYQLKNVGSGKCAEYNSPWNFQARDCNSGSGWQQMDFGSESSAWYKISNDESFWGTSCMWSAAWGGNIEGTLGNCALGDDERWQVKRVGSLVITVPFLPMN